MFTCWGWRRASQAACLAPRVSSVSLADGPALGHSSLGTSRGFAQVCGWLLMKFFREVGLEDLQWSLPTVPSLWFWFCEGFQVIWVMTMNRWIGQILRAFCPRSPRVVAVKILPPRRSDMDAGTSPSSGASSWRDKVRVKPLLEGIKRPLERQTIGQRPPQQGSEAGLWPLDCKGRDLTPPSLGHSPCWMCSIGWKPDWAPQPHRSVGLRHFWTLTALTASFRC